MPSRIISLVPSQTELLADLGLDTEVAGITKFCVHPPEWRHSKTIVGGTKNIRMDTIERLAPDLILANKEENVKEQVEKLAMRYPVWTSDISNLQEALEMIIKVGDLTNTSTRARELVKDIESAFSSLTGFSPCPRVLYLIWKEPFMSIGSDTFIHAMLETAGFNNLCAGMTRYPELTVEDIREMAPEVIILSSEPYPFREKHRLELASLFPESRVLPADGEMFSWYGSRLLKAPAYFASLRNEILSYN